ncbi:MAG: hypothetical protein ACI8Z5_000870 [Lentimonas sp.]|jgi:hypothetical protein
MKNLIAEEFAKTIPLIVGKPFWSNGEPRGAVRSFFIQMVDQGRFTVEEIQHEMRSRYPDIKEGTVKGYPRHATNENGIDKDKTRMPYKAIIIASGIIRFDKTSPSGSW